VQEAKADVSSVAHSFTVMSDNRCLVLAAGSAEEKDKWMEDIAKAGAVASDQGHAVTGAKTTTYPSLKSASAFGSVQYEFHIISYICSASITDCIPIVMYIKCR